MKTGRGLPVIAAVLVIVLVQTCATATAQLRRAATCQRHAPVGFVTPPPEILGELGQVYANCYPQPTCPSPAELETIQVDGYGDYSKWVWTGLSTATFSEAQQNAIIDKAIAVTPKPSGKVIVSLAFFRDIIVGLPPTYVMYFKATLARCAQTQTRKGMTWIHSVSNAQTGTITVGCGPTGPNPCDPRQGDTACTELRPLLCIYKPTPPFPVPSGVNNSDQYYRWSGGVVATTAPVAGNTFAHISATPGTDANSYCAAQFGAGWRVAEFHDGWGWNFQAYGGTVSAPTVPSARFWVHINDQPAGNCWATP